MAGISREHLSRIESSKVAVTEEMKVKLLEALEKFNPEAPLTMLFDYVKIRFPTLDIQHIIKDILKLNINYMLHTLHRLPRTATLPYYLEVTSFPYQTRLSVAVSKFRNEI